MAIVSKGGGGAAGAGVGALAPGAGVGWGAGWWPGVVVLVVTLLAFANGLTGPLVLDDYYTITYNPTIRQVWPPGPMWAPPAKSGVGGRPVANVSYAVSYAISGVRPVGHHAVSVGVHLIAAWLMFSVLKRVLELPGLRGRFGRDAGVLAGLGALLWAVHPLQTQVVTYVSQRTESLMAMFYLATLYGFLRCADEGADAGRRKAWGWFAVGACALGMGSKETMVTAPVMVLVLDRCLVAGTFTEAWRKRWGLYAGLAATWFILAWLMVGLRERDVGFGVGASVWDYALTQCKSLVLYVKLTFWPHPLVFDRGPVYVRTLAEAAPWALGLGVLLTGTVYALRRWPLAGLAAAWFFIVLAPTSSVVPVAQQPIAENRPHLALAGVVVLVVLGLYARLGRTALAVGGLIAAALVVGTWQRNRVFTDDVELWRETAARAPLNARAHHNLAAALQTHGRSAEAVEAYKATLAIDPEHDMAHMNLADSLCVLGRDAEAIEHYRHGLRKNPAQAKAQANLAVALHRTGQTAEAIGAFEYSLKLDPASVEVYYNYGTALLQAGRPADASETFRKALKLAPNQANVMNGLGLALQTTGAIPEAMAQFERAIALVPDYPDPHANLGIALANLGRIPEAITQWETALRLKPDYPGIAANLARARQMLATPPAAPDTKK